MEACNTKCLREELDMAKARMAKKDAESRRIDLELEEAKAQVSKAYYQMIIARGSYRSTSAEYNSFYKELHYLEKNIGKGNAKSEKRQRVARDIKDLGPVLYQRKIEEITNRLEAEWLSAYDSMIAVNVLYLEACKRRNSLEFDDEVATCDFVDAKNEVAALTRQLMGW